MTASVTRVTNLESVAEFERLCLVFVAHPMEMNWGTKLSDKYDAVLCGVVHQHSHSVVAVQQIPFSLAVVVRKSHSHRADVRRAFFEWYDTNISHLLFYFKVGKRSHREGHVERVECGSSIAACSSAIEW